MSLLDLLRLMKKHWIILLVAALVCGAAGLVYGIMSKPETSETAIARVVANSQIGGVLSLADAETRDLLDTSEDGPDADYNVKLSIPSGQTTLEIAVSGPEAERCIEVANEIATNTAQKAGEFFVGYENPYSGYAELATEVEEQAPVKGALKFILVGLLVGLFLALCVILLLDLKKRSIKSLEGMQDAVELPALEKLPATNGERLLANMRFAAENDNLESVCLVPLSAASPASEVSSLLEGAIAAEHAAGREAQVSAVVPTITVCEPLSANMSAAYEARTADAVLVIGKQWADSLKDLETTVAELQLAGATLLGLVYAE